MGLRWGDIEAVRGLRYGHRQGNSKKGEGGSKVLIFHYVPQSHSLKAKEGTAGLEWSGVAKDLGRSGNGLGKEGRINSNYPEEQVMIYSKSE